MAEEVSIVEPPSAVEKTGEYGSMIPEVVDVGVDVDVEAAHPKKDSETGEEPTAETEKTALKVAPHCNDTDANQTALAHSLIAKLRITALTLLLLQISALQTISTHLCANTLDLPYMYPTLFSFFNLFIGHTRTIAVPLLFLAAGASAQLALERAAVLRYIVARRWRTGVFVVGYQTAGWLVRSMYPLPELETRPLYNGVTPYTSRREGMEAVMNGPVAYVLAVHAMDCVYAVHLRIGGTEKNGRWRSGQLITTQTRYNIAMTLLIFLPPLWVYACGGGHIQLPSTGLMEMDDFKRQLSTLFSTEIHLFPVHIAAYASGTQLMGSLPFLLASVSHSPRKLTERQSLALALCLSFLALAPFSRFFPSGAAFLDARQQPVLHLSEPAAAAAYATWVLYLIAAIPEALVNLLWITKSDSKIAIRVSYMCVAAYMQCLLLPWVEYRFRRQNGHLIVGWVVLMIPSMGWIYFTKMASSFCHVKYEIDVEAWWRWMEGEEASSE